MKKTFLLLICMSTLLYSCDSYTGAGAFSGAQIGSILGSAIGGLSGGPRGSDLGTIVGMAGGAAVGAAVGQAADQRQASRVSDMPHRRSVQRDGAPYQDRYGQTVVPIMAVSIVTCPSVKRSWLIPRLMAVASTAAIATMTVSMISSRVIILATTVPSSPKPVCHNIRASCK